jgi:hypothetical protein
MSIQKSNRVLSRTGARELSEEESNKVKGGLATATKCTAPSPTDPKGDGDPHECS